MRDYCCRLVNTLVSVQLLQIVTSVFSASEEMKWFVSVDLFSRVAMTLSICWSTSLGGSSANMTDSVMHAFLDTWERRESTGFTISLNTAPEKVLGCTKRCLWNIAALLITLHESNVLDQSELLRLSIAYRSYCSGLASGFSSVSYALLESCFLSSARL